MLIGWRLGRCPGEQRPPLCSGLLDSICDCLPLQVSCTALCLHSAMSMCFLLGLTSTHLTTLAAPVFMLLLLEGIFSFPHLEKRAGEWFGPPLPTQLSSPCTLRAVTAEKAVHFHSLSPSVGLWQLLDALILIPYFPFRNVECLNLLLSSGADLRRRDKFGR